MSEKRFKKGDNFSCLSCLDTETKKSYWYACNLCGLLNEQQDKISRLEEENEQLKAKVKRLQDIATRTEEEKEHYADLYNECRRAKLSDKAIKQAYAELNRREREKHCNGNTTFTATMKQNEMVY